MSAALAPGDWTEANQRLLNAELARLKQRLGADGDAHTLECACQAARAAMPSPAAIDELTHVFGLSSFERDTLLMCAGAELDAQFAYRCESGDEVSRRSGTTFGLALAAFEAAHWSAVAPVRPLRRWRLVELDVASGLCRTRLRIDERILHYLVGINYLDTRLRGLVHPVLAPRAMAQTHRELVETVSQTLRGLSAAAPPVVWLSGEDPAGQADVAAETARALGLNLHVLHLQDLPNSHGEIDALATLWDREALLLGAALLLDADTDVLPHTATRLIEQLGSLVFTTGQPPPLARRTLRLTVDKPAPAEQRQLWHRALGPQAGRVGQALEGIATQFRLSARTIQVEGERLAPALMVSDCPERLLWTTCRALGSLKLDELAQRIEPVSGWDDLILPDEQKATLRHVCAQVRNRLKVHTDWEFAESGARGLGITVLFAGESGTGKTMAAEVLARDLQLHLYRIDLSAVVSKYIGETEKNLRRVFDAAEDSGAILLFDEADALFGKRSEVKDSHDRYSNIEVSYLLQRMESYRGLAILTTNLRHALDVSFERRLRFIVQFSFPDQVMREAIWRQALPTRTPRTGLDYSKLARLGASGGSIRNIVLSAAFRAAESGEPISMGHLLQAARQEAMKQQRPVSDAETRGWV
jgi:hypothetical protein